MTLQGPGTQISLADIHNEFGGDYSLGGHYRGAGGVGEGAPNVPYSGTIGMYQFYGESKFFTVNCAITGYTPTFNVRSYAIGQGWDGSTPLIFNLTINSGCVIYDTGGGWALNCNSINAAAGSVINIYNYGYIVGAGGAGGAGGGMTSGNGGNGAGGSHAILCNSDTYVKIWNWGGIYGGGGGGAGSGAWYSATPSTYTDSSCHPAQFDEPGNGGGGGGGWVGGSGGAAGVGETMVQFMGGGGNRNVQGSSPIGNYGVAGTSGGWNYGGQSGVDYGSHYGLGGSVGNYGNGGFSDITLGGSGGPPGYYIYGNGNVSYQVAGSLAGLLA